MPGRLHARLCHICLVSYELNAQPLNRGELGRLTVGRCCRDSTVGSDEVR